MNLICYQKWVLLLDCSPAWDKALISLTWGSCQKTQDNCACGTIHLLVCLFGLALFPLAAKALQKFIFPQTV
jgi:hypothetical protein